MLSSVLFVIEEGRAGRAGVAGSPGSPNGGASVWLVLKLQRMMQREREGSLHGAERSPPLSGESPLHSCPNDEGYFETE